MNKLKREKILSRDSTNSSKQSYILVSSTIYMYLIVSSLVTLHNKNIVLHCVFLREGSNPTNFGSKKTSMRNICIGPSFYDTEQVELFYFIVLDLIS